MVISDIAEVHKNDIAMKLSKPTYYVRRGMTRDSFGFLCIFNLTRPLCRNAEMPRSRDHQMLKNSGSAIRLKPHTGKLQYKRNTMQWWGVWYTDHLAPARRKLLIIVQCWRRRHGAMGTCKIAWMRMRMSEVWRKVVEWELLLISEN